MYKFILMAFIGALLISVWFVDIGITKDAYVISTCVLWSAYSIVLAIEEGGKSGS